MFVQAELTLNAVQTAHYTDWRSRALRAYSRGRFVAAFAGSAHSVQHPFVRRKGLEDYQRRWKEVWLRSTRLCATQPGSESFFSNGVPEDRLYHLPLLHQYPSPPLTRRTWSAQPS